MSEPQRFTVVSDNDGHDYCIPVEAVKEFDAWLDDEERSTYTECSKYDEYRLDGGRLTFTDPKVGNKGVGKLR